MFHQGDGLFRCLYGGVFRLHTRAGTDSSTYPLGMMVNAVEV